MIQLMYLMNVLDKIRCNELLNVVFSLNCPLATPLAGIDVATSMFIVGFT